MDAVTPFTAASVTRMVAKAIPAAQSGRIEWAFALASMLYKGKILPQSTDLPLLDHVCGSLEQLIEFCPDEDAAIACLLQHSLKMPDFSMQQLEEQFGKNVRTIVSRVHLLSHVNADEWRRSIDDMKIMLVSVSDDIRVILLRLCIQSYLMSNLHHLEPGVHARVAREALNVFAPIAARLGIYTLKYRLEDKAFPVLYPVDSENIGSQLDILHREHGTFLPQTESALRAFLEREGVNARVTAREKHPYSLFQKMRRKSLTSISRIADLIALRVIVKSQDDCYQTLGLLHRLARPMQHRFKDYISFPKPNGYQSLHTCLIALPHAPADLMIEVQIRTEEMHREAEYGIAAHWMYKEGTAVKRSTYALQLSDILLSQHMVGSEKPDEEAMRLVDHIYVLTPRGDIRELPERATPLDFAFMIHSDIGLKFKAARVNGSIVPVSHRLENGDVVEIITHSHPKPSLQWLEILRTNSARSKLKAYFFSHNRVEFISRGKALLNAEFKSRGLPLLDADLSVLSTFDGTAQNTKEREDLLVKIGMGSVRVSTILKHLGLEEIPVKRIQQRKVTRVKKQKLIEVVGSSADMPCRFAKCCAVDAIKPRPTDIIGFITRLGAISIHKTGCKMIRSANKERRVRVKWVGG